MSSIGDIDLIDAIIYGDAFDCAVTFDEIRRYSRVGVKPAELGERLARLVLQNLIGERGGFYFLAGRQELADLRAVRRRRAERLRRRARTVARWLQHAPFVRGVVLTGSVAADDADESADVDILVIVAHERIALAFALLGTISRLISRRVFCPNYYLSEAHLALSRHDYYIARELVQSEPLTERSDALVAANSWAQALLPNTSVSKNPVLPLPGGAMVQRLCELAFGGRFGEWSERQARGLAASRLRAHYGSFRRAVPEEVQERFEQGVELRFHAAPRINYCIEQYETRRAEIAPQIAAANRTGHEIPVT